MAAQATRPLEAENAVVGSFLIDPSCFRKVKELLRPEDMALAINQAIYRAALKLDRAGSRLDPVTIRDTAAKDGDEISGQYMVELMDQTPTAANVEEYCRITREASLRRAITEATKDAEKRSATGEAPQEILSDTIQTLEQLRQEGTEKALLTPEEQMLRFVDHRDMVDSGKASAYVPTGYRDLDRMLGGGMLCSGLYVLAARPGMGKTTLAINIADRVAGKTGPVLFVSLEMDDNQLSSKRLARLCGIPGNRLLMDKLNELEYDRLQIALDAVSALPVAMNGLPTATVEQIGDLAGQVRGLKLIVVDYLGKISPGAKANFSSRYDYTTEISGKLKDLARRYKVPVLLLAQLNREVEKRNNHRPQLSDLRDSGAVEQDADGVIFLYRKTYYGDEANKDRHAPEITEVDLAKNRHGAVGECELAFSLATSKVTAMSNDPRESYREDLKYTQQTLPWEGEYNHVGETESQPDG